jgi:hypothetical protein
MINTNIIANPILVYRFSGQDHTGKKMKTPMTAIFVLILASDLFSCILNIREKAKICVK